MPNPNALWEDIQKLDDLYEELLWHPDDELQFTHDGEKIIITKDTRHKTQDKTQDTRRKMSTSDWEKDRGSW